MKPIIYKFLFIIAYLLHMTLAEIQESQKIQFFSSQGII